MQIRIWEEKKWEKIPVVSTFKYKLFLKIGLQK